MAPRFLSNQIYYVLLYPLVYSFFWKIFFKFCIKFKIVRHIANAHLYLVEKRLVSTNILRLTWSWPLKGKERNMPFSCFEVEKRAVMKRGWRVAREWPGSLWGWRQHMGRLRRVLPVSTRYQDIFLTTRICTPQSGTSPWAYTICEELLRSKLCTFSTSLDR